METTLIDGAEQALAAMRAAGFAHAQVTLRRTRLSEVNANNDEASLLRSHEQAQLVLQGLVEQRKAATVVDAALLQDTPALQQTLARLRADAMAAPADEANAVSAGQQVQIVQGPQEPDLDALVDTMQALLAWRSAHTPGFRLGEAAVTHRHVAGCTLTSGGSRIQTTIGSCGIDAIGAARDGARASSFTFAGGHCHDLRAQAPHERFGIGTMMLDAVASLSPQPLQRKFTGDVVLSPLALASLLEWLLGQLGDDRLISHSSVYRERVGQRIAAPALTLRSRFDGAGVAAVSADAFACPPVQPLQAGVLTTLLPSLYGARRTGLAHVPAAADGGWAVDGGDQPLAELLAGVREGALVGRFSMGAPAPSGDFSGVIKNSFLIEGGVRGPALAETMVAGNMAQMLQDITAISRERIDYGGWWLPWVRISGMHFS